MTPHRPAWSSSPTNFDKFNNKILHSPKMDEKSLRVTVLWLYLIRIHKKLLKFLFESSWWYLISKFKLSFDDFQKLINSFSLIIDTYSKFNDRLQVGQRFVALELCWSLKNGQFILSFFFCKFVYFWFRFRMKDWGCRPI